MTGTGDATPLTPSVRRIRDEIGADEVTASSVAGVLQRFHPEYAWGRFGAARLTVEGDDRRSIDAWLDLVRGDDAAADADAIHGRLLLYVLATKDETLRGALRDAGVWHPLQDELGLTRAAERPSDPAGDRTPADEEQPPADRPAAEQLEYSPSVRRALRELSDAGEVPAAAILFELQRLHPEYGWGNFRNARIDPGVDRDIERRAVEHWLGLAHQAADEVGAPVIHGRLVVVALARHDAYCRDALIRADAWRPLQAEVGLPVEPRRSFGRRFVSRFLRNPLAWFAAAAATVAAAIQVAARTDPPTITGAPGASELGGAADLARSVLGIGIVTGLVALAVVQAVKHLTTLRGTFHRLELEDHLGPQPFGQLLAALGEAAFGTAWEPGRVSGGSVRSSGVGGRLAETLARWRDRRRARYFFDLPLEQLAGQIANAAEAALANAGGRRALLSALAPDAAEEIAILYRDPVVLRTKRMTDDSRADPEAARRVIAVRMHRSIDSLQIVIGHRWRALVRAAALVVCVPVAITALEFSDAVGSARVVTTVGATVVGAFVAWAGRDIVAGFERWRRS